MWIRPVMRLRALISDDTLFELKFLRKREKEKKRIKGEKGVYM